MYKNFHHRIVNAVKRLRYIGLPPLKPYVSTPTQWGSTSNYTKADCELCGRYAARFWMWNWLFRVSMYDFYGEERTRVLYAKDSKGE